jgi:hypothetical protein
MMVMQALSLARDGYLILKSRRSFKSLSNISIAIICKSSVILTYIISVSSYTFLDSNKMVQFEDLRQTAYDAEKDLNSYQAKQGLGRKSDSSTHQPLFSITRNFQC